MDQKIAEEWAEALVSERFPQTTGRLHDNKGYCCLGVLCELYLNKHPELPAAWREVADDEDGTKLFNDGNEHSNWDAFVPQAVRDWAKMRSYDGTFWSAPNTVENLAVLNDSGSTFEQIAEIIREKAEEL